MNYDEITGTLLVLAAIPRNSEDSNYERILPAAFLYADGRIYRELNFLATDITQEVTLISNERDFVLPPDVLTVHYINVCTPAGPITSSTKRRELERVSESALNMFWPNPGFKRSLPKKYAIIGQRRLGFNLPSPLPPTTQPLPPLFQPELFSHVVRFMPTPDRAYMAEVNGGVQPQPLSQTNPETYLSVRYPELFIACCMVFITGYQRDYGAMADDPQRAVSWEGQYTKLKDGIALEAGMQRGEGPRWTSYQPAPIAQQPRSP
jgi:hypothetical protein